MRSERYLHRVCVAPDEVRAPDEETLALLQRSHVTTVPFETLAVAGGPFGEYEGRGVSLDPEPLAEKIVERERGGFCYELNGLFGRLLADLGFDVDRVAARVIENGELTPPASHMTHVVSLDRRYLVDVGMGVPTMRRPTPLDGTAREDAAGVRWRTVESDRPDADYVAQYREPESDGWSDRYLFRDVPRETCYFEATCDHLATAPESGFTGDPVVSIATGRGHKKLGTDSLTRFTRDGVIEEPVAEDEWFDVLEREFGVRIHHDGG